MEGRAERREEEREERGSSMGSATEGGESLGVETNELKRPSIAREGNES